MAAAVSKSARCRTPENADSTDAPRDVLRAANELQPAFPSAGIEGRLLLKCEGLDDGQRKARPVETPKLSLHGLVRHMAEVERNWFRRVLLQEAAARIWYDPAVEDSELVPLDDALWEADLAAWTLECEHSRAAAAQHHLDDTGIRHGTPCSLRWIYVHMIEEYARHNGHADFLRELVEGTVGW